MSNIKWPEWMPYPQPDSYNYQAEDRRRKSDMEMGSVYRKEFDTDETKCSCTIVLDEFQSSFFESFERDILEQGTKWFLFPLLVGGAIKHHTVRFVERPKMVALIGAVKQEYSLTFIVSKRITMDKSIAELLLFYTAEDLLFMSSELHAVLHEQIPTTLDVPVWRDYD